MFRVVLLVVAVVVLGGALRSSDAVAQEPLSISGTVWWDVNGDGIRQPNESGLSRLGVSLLGQGGVLASSLTDEQGGYSFGGLQPGLYAIRTTEFFGMSIQTYPSRRLEPPFVRPVTVENKPVAGVNFGFYRIGREPAFMGLAFINAGPANNPKIRAFVGGLDCTLPGGILPTDLDPATYMVTVASSDLLAGCGQPGDVVSFTVNGLLANESAIWQPVPPNVSRFYYEENRSLRLTVGPSFDVFWPRVQERDGSGDPVFGYGYTVAAMIDGRVCAVGLPRVWDSIMVIVPSETMTPRCGREGATVSFAVDGFATSEMGVWSEKPQDEYEELVLDLVKSETAALEGPKFAYYWIDLPAMVPTHPLFDEVEQIVIATIDGEYCGQGRGVGPRRVLVAVAPAELREGCGRPGAPVAFSQTNEPYATVTWQPGFHEGPAAPGIAQAGELAPAPAEEQAPSKAISPPSVGNGGLR